MDAESAWLSLDPDNAHRPGVLSQGWYGPRVGLPLILDLLRRHGLKATFFVPGVIAEAYESRIREILGEGHELGLHGYTHTAPARLTAVEERAELGRARASLAKIGAHSTGYRAPHGDVSESTVEILDESGIEYASQFVDDIWPYRHSGRRLIELPLNPLLNDWPHFSGTAGRNIRAAHEVFALWKEEFDALRDAGACVILTMHPQVIGRPSRVKMLDRLIEYIRSTEGVWVATCAHLAAHVHRVLDAQNE